MPHFDDCWYDVAQICLQGHISNSYVKDRPQHNRKRCRVCGSETIIACPACSMPIQGSYHVPGFGSEELKQLPAFCHECGEAYTWTVSRLDSACDLADQLGLDVPNRALLDKSIEELIRDTPRAPAEAVRFKAIVEKAQPWGLEAFRQIIGAAVGEAAKKLIWPGS
jgi:hypothetical protein